MADGIDPASVAALVQRIGRAGSGEHVSVADIVEEIGDDAFAPLLLVPALILVSPASGIPGLSSLGGLVMALISFQMIAGRKVLWLPAFIRNRTIAKARLQRASAFLEKPARVIDRITRKRLAFLTAWPLRLVPLTICLAAALIIPFFELVPFSATIIGSAISLFALAMVTRDGLLVLFGTGTLGGAGYLGWSLATGG
ncbi:exopolysaccharide biosynthesis protein [Aquamicrobium sp. LC103]|uniref:exopolysaccharide biosynthesis protein n=1 Tax=Aquamicrobium sp. LC103 TaxID=1120658 RepID=UPI00063E7513|nr:exopolysaccharide biosynthesis protein [Aquamicrobium sp. LC103]